LVDVWRPDCPMCGDWLSIIVSRDKKTKEIVVSVECEWCDDFPGFTIRTRIKQKDIKELGLLLKPIKKEMEIVPNPERKSFPDEPT